MVIINETKPGTATFQKKLKCFLGISKVVTIPLVDHLLTQLTLLKAGGVELTMLDIF